VSWIKPLLPFTKVIKYYGYPVVSKRVARYVSDLRKAHGINDATKHLRLTGYNRQGIYCPSMKLSEKWMYLINAPFDISEKCCDIMKKEPFKRYVKETGRKAYVGVMAIESAERQKQYLKTGCNAFNLAEPKSMPLGFWTENDVLEYLKINQLPYASVYGDIVEKEGGYSTTGVYRTGCMYCMFGITHEKTPNRFQQMKHTHPHIYEYCMNNLNLKKVLSFLNVPYN
jgi:hypothetical protein